MVKPAPVCISLVFAILVIFSYGEADSMEDFTQKLPSSPRQILGKVYHRRILDDTSIPTPTATTTPTIITVPSVYPGTGTSTNPYVPSTTPVTLPPFNPVNTPVPVNNPVTSPTVPGTQPITNPVNSPVPVTNPTSPASTGAPAIAGQSWCVAKAGALQSALQSALDYACGMGGADCSQIQQGGSCYNPNALQNHASFAFNSYYQKNPAPTSCDFGGAATLVNANPSSGSCIYPTSTSTSTSTSTPSTPLTPLTSSPLSSSSPLTTTPTATPTTTSSSSSSGPVDSSYGTSPTVLNSSGTPSGMAPVFGSDSPLIGGNTTSSSSGFQPLVGCLFLMTSFAIGKLSIVI